MNPMLETSLPFSQACENNKDFILDVIKRHLKPTDQVLEIGSGTGQHAQYFASKNPTLLWQTTDLGMNLDGLKKRIAYAALQNLPEPLELDVSWSNWPITAASNIFSSNSLHIMSEPLVKLFFDGVGRHLIDNGFLMVYGPFKYNGEFTSQSNAQFDSWLKSRDSLSGIRDFELVNQYASNNGLELLEDYNMPANNQLLTWLKTGTAIQKA